MQNKFEKRLLTICIVRCAESISSDLHWLLEEHRSEGIHGNVKPKADQCEDTHNQHNRGNKDEEWDCCNMSLGFSSVSELYGRSLEKEYVQFDVLWTSESLFSLGRRSQFYLQRSSQALES